jgi:hypothetical protein
LDTMHSWHSYLDSATPRLTTSINVHGAFPKNRSSVEVTLGNAPYSDSDRTCSRVIKRRSRVAVSSMAAPRLKGII